MSETRQTILILEDDDRFRETLQETLEDFYVVHGAASAAEALRLAEGTRFDLVISDVRMAGMDGLECLAQLRERFPQLESIVMTGYADEDAPPRALQVQASDYLYKPFTISQLLMAVRRVLDRKKERGSYLGLLQSVVAGYKRLVGQDPESLAQREMAAVELRHDATFRTLFVAIRSRAMDERIAYALWIRLEQLEEELEKARDPILSHSEARQRLSGDYEALQRLVQAAARPRSRRASPDQFARLFARVQAGDVSTEQLILAPFIRDVPEEVRAGSGDLQQLYSALWAEQAPV
ncbi:MAG: response regulator [Candidatus Eremiobacterota bacterium]